MYSFFWILELSVLKGEYEGVSKSFRTEPITKYTLTTLNTRWEATQRIMAAKLTRLTHKITIQLHIVVESCTVCSSRSRRPVRKLLIHTRMEKYWYNSTGDTAFGIWLLEKFVWHFVSFRVCFVLHTCTQRWIYSCLSHFHKTILCDLRSYDHCKYYTSGKMGFSFKCTYFRNASFAILHTTLIFMFILCCEANRTAESPLCAQWSCSVFH